MIGTITTWILTSKLARQVAAIALFVGGIFVLGAKWSSGKHKAKEAKIEENTNDRINDADVGAGDADLDREWLRKRGKR
jgi:hypothetical protein